VLTAGFLFSALGGSYASVGTAAALIYGLGMLAIWWAPDTTRASLGFGVIAPGTAARFPDPGSRKSHPFRSEAGGS